VDWFEQSPARNNKQQVCFNRKLIHVRESQLRTRLISPPEATPSIRLRLTSRFDLDEAAAGAYSHPNICAE